MTTYIAMHPNRYRNVRKAADVVPAGWASNAEAAWQIESSDDQGHAVLEMTRGREYPKPWARYEFWLGQNTDGVRVAVIGEESKLSIMDLLAEKNPKHVPRSVTAAKEWLLAYLAEHGPSLVETEIFPAGKAAGHSEPALTKAKAISNGEIGHTPQGAGPSPMVPDAEALNSRPSLLSLFRQAHPNRLNRVGLLNKRVLTPTRKSWTRRMKFLGRVPEIPLRPQSQCMFRPSSGTPEERNQDGLNLTWLIPNDGHSWLWLNGPWNAPKGEPNPNPHWAAKLRSEVACGNVPRAATLWPYSPDADWFKELMKAPGVQPASLKASDEAASATGAERSAQAMQANISQPREYEVIARATT